MSWRELGRRIGVSHSHLVLIGQGRRVPSVQVVERITAALGLPYQAAESLRRLALEGRHEAVNVSL